MDTALAAIVDVLGDAFLSPGRVPALASAVLGREAVAAARALKSAATVPNLHGIGVTVSCEEPTISFFAVEPAELEFLPERIDGAKVEIVTSALPSIAPPARTPRPGIADEAPCTAQRNQRQRPLVGGISWGHPSVTAGTLGCVCTSNVAGEVGSFALSNHHVLADLGEPSSSNVVIQPGKHDAGQSPEDYVGILSRSAAVVAGLTQKNRVDCAVAELSVPAEPTICTIGKLDGIGEALVDLKVRKHGRTTGYTEGRISHVGYTTVLNYHGVLTRFSDQIRIVPEQPYPSFSEGGDSGAVIVKQDTQAAVGLLFAGAIDGSYSLANRIDLVIHALNISIP